MAWAVFDQGWFERKTLRSDARATVLKDAARLGPSRQRWVSGNDGRASLAQGPRRRHRIDQGLGVGVQGGAVN